MIKLIQYNKEKDEVMVSMSSSDLFTISGWGYGVVEEYSVGKEEFSLYVGTCRILEEIHFKEE